MKIVKSLNHGHFCTLKRVVYETLTNGETRKVIELDHYYPNWNVLSDQQVLYLNSDHVHHPEYVYPEKKKEIIPDLFT